MNIDRINTTIFYHGSPYRIDRFSLDFCGRGTDQNGAGFYVTSNRRQAIGYCENNEQKRATFNGMPEEPTLHVARLSVENPLSVDEIKSLSTDTVERFLKHSPSFDDALTNYGDVDWEGYEVVLKRAVQSYAGIQGPLIQTLHMIANDFFDGHVREFNDFVINTLGYDSFIERVGDDFIVTVLDEDLIEIVARKKLERESKYEQDMGIG